MEKRPIKGFERYTITPEGVVFSNWGGKEKVIKPRPDKDGYPYITLRVNNVLRTVKIHRLVAETYIPNVNNYPCVCHNNGKPDDNRVENLRWDTMKGNLKDRHIHGTHFKGSRNPAAKINEKIVKEIKEAYVRENISQEKIAKRYNVCQTTVSHIVTGRSWK